MIPVPLAAPDDYWVLVVEDNFTVRLLVTEGLRDAGLQVVEARNADDALSYLAGGGQVSLLFTDIEMPGSMDGLQLARYVHEAYPALPVVIASGNGRPAAAGGLGMFVSKPYDIDDVTKLFIELLRREPPA